MQTQTFTAHMMAATAAASAGRLVYYEGGMYNARGLMRSQDILGEIILHSYQKVMACVSDLATERANVYRFIVEQDRITFRLTVVDLDSGSLQNTIHRLHVPQWFYNGQPTVVFDDISGSSYGPRIIKYCISPLEQSKNRLRVLVSTAEIKVVFYPPTGPPLVYNLDPAIVQSTADSVHLWRLVGQIYSPYYAGLRWYFYLPADRCRKVRLVSIRLPRDALDRTTPSCYVVGSTYFGQFPFASRPHKHEPYVRDCKTALEYLTDFGAFENVVKDF